MTSLGNQIDTLIIGAGQAGIAASEHLSRAGIPHTVLERDRIAEAWRSKRWDSLVANGPAWHDRFPGLVFEGLDKDEFATKDRIADYFEDYAKMIEAPVRTGVEVTSVERMLGRPEFSVNTSQGSIMASRVIVATGPFQRPMIPSIAPQLHGVSQIHSAEYRSPEKLSSGAVLVVGAGSSGVQIADELQRSGRQVYLSVGPHERPPRSYRGRDFVWWLGVLGDWDAIANEKQRGHVTISVSGARNGHTVDFRALGHQGVTLLGRAKAFDGAVLHLEPDLRTNITQGDNSYFELLDAADAYIEKNGLTLPLEPEARRLPADPPSLETPISHLALSEVGINTIIWATGYSRDYSWLKADAFDESGAPCHQRGVSKEQGIYFLGLPWLSRRGSSFIWGVWHDAKYIADHIATQRSYMAYRGTKEQSTKPVPDDKDPSILS